MAEHTPGPWTAEISPEIALVIVRGPDGEVIVSDDNSLSDANAHLIAAAPDLLTALKKMVSDLDDVPYGIEAFEQAEAAIAKAEGKS